MQPCVPISILYVFWRYCSLTVFWCRIVVILQPSMSVSSHVCFLRKRASNYIYSLKSNASENLRCAIKSESFVIRTAPLGGPWAPNTKPRNQGHYNWNLSLPTDCWLTDQQQTFTTHFLKQNGSNADKVAVYYASINGSFPLSPLHGAFPPCKV